MKTCPHCQFRFNAKDAEYCIVCGHKFIYFDDNVDVNNLFNTLFGRKPPKKEQQ
ncbi:MAG: hypothetical protein WCY05_01910 [Candidatus Omnitrophota bacterium]